MKLSLAVEHLVEACRQDVPDCIGAGVVDLSTGMMLDSDTVDDHPGEVLEILAAATVDMFQGRAVREVEQMWKSRRGDSDDRHSFQEILINSTNLVHLFIRSRRYSDIAVTVVCRNTVKVGLLFAQARRIVRDFDAAE
jgi:hypothetical protein